MEKVGKETTAQNKQVNKKENKTASNISQNVEASTYSFADNDLVDMTSQMVDMSSEMVDMSSEMVDMTSQTEYHCDVSNYEDVSPYEEEECLEDNIVTIPYMEENVDVTNQNASDCDVSKDGENDCDITVTSLDVENFQVSENDGKYSGPEFDIYIEVCLVVYFD